jgi:hypothetical protein
LFFGFKQFSECKLQGFRRYLCRAILELSSPDPLGKAADLKGRSALRSCRFIQKQHMTTARRGPVR